ncbi:MAG: HAD family hydrolase [Selenomonadaceae bacterium]|nr:HAD family hydrolase [Selenomonadaceae bacterium]
MRHTAAFGAALFFAAELGIAALSFLYFLHSGNAPGDCLRIAAGVFAALLPTPFLTARVLPPRLGRKRARAALREGSDRTVQSRRFLAELAAVDTLAFCRRGVLTTGKVHVADVVPEGINPRVLLLLAASAESGARHPVGRAILDFAREKGIEPEEPLVANEIPHAGVEAIVNRVPVRVGTADWLQKEHVRISADLLTLADQLSTRGQMPIFVAEAGRARGILVLEESLRLGMGHVMKELQALGVRTMLCTAANKRLSRAYQKRVPFDEIRAESSAADTAQALQLLGARSHIAAWAGRPAENATELAANATEEASGKATPQTDGARAASPADTAALDLSAFPLEAIPALIEAGRHMNSLRRDALRVAIFLLLVLLLLAFLPPLLAGLIVPPPIALLMNLIGTTACTVLLIQRG